MTNEPINPRREKVRIKVKLGDKGQLAIPKIIRESVGLKENGSAVLEVKENIIEIDPSQATIWFKGPGRERKNTGETLRNFAGSTVTSCIDFDKVKGIKRIRL